MSIESLIASDSQVSLTEMGYTLNTFGRNCLFHAILLFKSPWPALSYSLHSAWIQAAEVAKRTARLAAMILNGIPAAALFFPSAVCYLTASHLSPGRLEVLKPSLEGPSLESRVLRIMFHNSCFQYPWSLLSGLDAPSTRLDFIAHAISRENPHIFCDKSMKIWAPKEP